MKKNATNTSAAAVAKKIEYRKYRTAAGGEIVAIYARIDERGWLNANAIAADIAAPYYSGKLATARACVAIVKVAEKCGIPLRQPQRDEAAAAAIAIEEAHKQAQEQRLLADIVAARNPAELLDVAERAGELATARKMVATHKQIARACKRFGYGMSDFALEEARRVAEEKAEKEAAAKEAAKKYAQKIAEAAKSRAEYERKEAAAKEAAKKAKEAAKKAKEAERAAKKAAKDAAK